MSHLSKYLHRKLPPTGRAAKTLTAIYLLLLFILIQAILATYGNGHTHKVSWLLFGCGIIISILPAFFGWLHDNIYTVALYGAGKRHRRQLLAQLDERQLQDRRRIFELTYGIVVSAYFLLSFLLPTYNLSSNGVFMLNYALAMMLFGLPSIVATWTLQPVSSQRAADKLRTQ